MTGDRSEAWRDVSVAAGVVVPTVGRPSLHALLDSLSVSAAGRPSPLPVVVVDDTVEASVDVAARPGLAVRVVRSGGHGPATARNLGWLGLTTAWVCFLDDDVTVSPTWCRDLCADLAGMPAEVVAVQGRVTVPPPLGREPTDAERGTLALASTGWITADLAVRRSALEAVGGFDQRFVRAFREDSDLALRLQDRGGAVVHGRRTVVHPPKTGGWTASVRAQSGNDADMLMRRVHGRRWQARAGTEVGRRARHHAVVGVGLGASVAAAAGRRRTAALLASVWCLATAEFAWSRVRPGPRTPTEVARMTASSVLIPPVAVAHAMRGRWRYRQARVWAPAGPACGISGTTGEVRAA